MCLDKITQEKVGLDKNGVGTGYKVFSRKWDIVNNEWYGKPHPELFGKRTYNFNTWYKSKRKKSIKIESNEKYIPCFHIFKAIASAKAWTYDDPGYWECICKVKFRNIICVGEQCWQGENHTVIVAREMMIPEDK